MFANRGGVEGIADLHEPRRRADSRPRASSRRRGRGIVACAIGTLVWRVPKAPFPACHRRLRPMKLKPLGGRLIVKAVEEEAMTVSGIVLPDTAKEKPQKGKVLAVGDGRISGDTGERIPLEVSEGDDVLYSKYGGTEITVEGEDLLVLRESDVLARVIG